MGKGMKNGKHGTDGAADYFNLFQKQSGAAVTVAGLLVKVIDDYASPESVHEHMERAHELENRSDEYCHQVYKRLARDFMTPIERDDIIDMTRELDDLIDRIEDVVLCFYMYDVQAMHAEARAFARLVKKSCKALDRAMGEFRNFKKSKEFKRLIIDVNTYEEEADRLFREVNRALYGDSGEEGKNLLVWSQIFGRMEQCCDACEHVADTMRGILLKNA
ncbi:DUF47 domain-containing protein [Enteroscipio rubneri]|nr:DUF47 family protein [Enteroscipio rubneri]